MENTTTKNAIEELNRISSIIDLKEFYCVTLWNLSELRLQGKFSSANMKAAKTLGITLEYDEEWSSLRGNDGFTTIVLTD